MVSQNNELTMQTASIRQNYLKVIGVHVCDTVVTEPETRFPVFFFHQICQLQAGNVSSHHGGY